MGQLLPFVIARNFNCRRFTIYYRFFGFEQFLERMILDEFFDYRYFHDKRLSNSTTLSSFEVELPATNSPDWKTAKNGRLSTPASFRAFSFSSAFTSKK